MKGPSLKGAVMNFETYLNQAWKDHATDALRVSNQLATGAGLAETNEHLSQLVGLATHVYGEHLGQWDQGIQFLRTLQSHRFFAKDTETDKAIQRSIAVLELASGQSGDLQAFTEADQIRVWAVAASAVSARDARQAKEFLQRALNLAQAGLDPKDPANRSLAITGNNLACALEEKKSRSAEETALMILAAQTARKYWKVAGTWLEVSRAEYRLAMTYLQSQDLAKALRHAQICLELCYENKAGELDLFFGHEALALVEKARHNEIGFQTALEQCKVHFSKLAEEDKIWCESALQKLA
jgi:hypothetical protein